MFKEIKKKIVDKAEEVLRKTGLSDSLICTQLRIAHAIFPIFTGLVLFFGTKNWFLFVVFINIFVFLLFFIFGGCILSSLEHRFTTDDYTVIDPLLIFLGLDLTNANRVKYTLLSNIFTCFLTAVLYYVRFGSNTLLENPQNLV